MNYFFSSGEDLLSICRAEGITIGEAMIRREVLRGEMTRTDIIDECKAKISVWSEFAPKMMDEAEIRKTISGVLEGLGIASPTAKDKGLIMKNLMPLVKGKADGGLVNKLVSEIIG